MRAKKLEDWEHYADLLCKKDPYNHMRSIHNCIPFYDHTRPWITHCSLQRQDLYRHVEYTTDYRTRYQKPIVWDEIAYEGNIDMAGAISPGRSSPAASGKLPCAAATQATARPS